MDSYIYWIVGILASPGTGLSANFQPYTLARTFLLQTYNFAFTPPPKSAIPQLQKHDLLLSLEYLLSQ